MNAKTAQHTPGPWDYVPANEHHGPYVTSDFGSTICDLYTMTNPNNLSVRNGGDSRPVPFLAEMADPNARLIAAAPDMLDALKRCEAMVSTDQGPPNWDWVREVIAKAVQS